MTKRSVTHADFTLERVYPVSPAKVFNAFADPQAKARWFNAPDDWTTTDKSMDFRVGGVETNVGRPPNGLSHAFTAIYQDIIPNERIIYTYEMKAGDQRMSVSLAVIEFHAVAAGTRLVLTEHGAFLDGIDTVDSRRHGTNELLDALGRSLT